MTVTSDERFDLELLRSATGYQQWAVRAMAIPSGVDMVEVGAGIGNFTRWMAPRARSVVAVEPDAAMCQTIQSLDLSNVEIASTRIEDLDGMGDRFDCAVLINVLEHLPDEALILQKIRHLLRPGGQLSVFAPAHQRLFGSLDERYQHLRRYSLQEIQQLVDGAGFSVRYAGYFNPVGAIGWLLVARLLRRRSLSLAAVLVSEWIAVPLGRGLEKLGPPPFGQSVVVVAEAEEATAG